MLKVEEGHLYDTISLSRHQSHMFLSSVGQYDHSLAREKGIADTNIMIGGMMPAPEKFVVESIEAMLLRDGKIVPLTADRLWSAVTIELCLMMDSKFGPVQIFQIADARCILADALAADIPEKLRAIDAVRRRLWEPIAIDSLQPFVVKVNSEEIDPSARLKISMRGKHFRAVGGPQEVTSTEEIEALRKLFDL